MWFCFNAKINHEKALQNQRSEKVKSQEEENRHHAFTWACMCVQLWHVVARTLSCERTDSHTCKLPTHTHVNYLYTMLTCASMCTHTHTYSSRRISIHRTRIAARICRYNANKPRECSAHMLARNIHVLQGILSLATLSTHSTPLSHFLFLSFSLNFVLHLHQRIANCKYTHSHYLENCINWNRPFFDFIEMLFDSLPLVILLFQAFSGLHLVEGFKKESIRFHDSEWCCEVCGVILFKSLHKFFNLDIWKIKMDLL